MDQELNEVLDAAQQLVRAEVSKLEQELRYRAMQFVWMFLALVALGTAFFFAVLAAYNLLVEFIGPVGAAGLVAAVCLLVAGALLRSATKPKSGGALLRRQLADETAKSARLNLELRLRDVQQAGLRLLRETLGLGRVAWEALMAVGQQLLERLPKTTDTKPPPTNVDEPTKPDLEPTLADATPETQ